jgi:hypothetical protein
MHTSYILQLFIVQVIFVFLQVPRSLVEFANRGLLTPECKGISAICKEDSCSGDHGDKDKADNHYEEAAYPETFDSPEELLAALKLHVDEKTLENQLNYRAVEDALSMSLHAGKL